MKNILQIAKAELRMMFCSPIAWLILIIFTVMCALEFFSVLSPRAELATSSGLGRQIDMTRWLFTNPATTAPGLFFRLKSHLYMFLPLLTMGLISQELSSGTIKLLLSSPVTNRKIVLGKFATMMAYGLVMMAVVMLMAIFSSYIIDKFDWPTIYSGLLGLYLLFLTYAAIGIFMSSLTTYQVVAAISTFAIFAALDMVGRLRLSSDGLIELTQWISMQGRVEELLAGMISSQDVAYFLIITAVFLTLTSMRLTNKGKARSASVRWGGYAAVVVVGCVLGILSSQPKLIFFKDTTHTKRLTITPNSQQIMKQVEGPVEVTNYVNIVGTNYLRGLFEGRTQEKKYVWTPYMRYKRDMKLRYVYYWHESDYESIMERMPDMTWEERAALQTEILNLGVKILKDDEIDAIIDLSDEGYRLVSSVSMADGRQFFMRKFNDNQIDPREAEISASFKRMVAGPVKVGFLAGHGERSISGKADSDYRMFAGDKYFRFSLLNNGFDAVRISLADGPIPDDVRILVISDPREPLKEEEQAAIMRYVESGRNLIIAGEPRRGHILNPIAEALGVRFTEGQIVNPQSEDLAQNLIMGRPTPEIKEHFTDALVRFLSTRDKARMSMPGVVGIETTGGGGFPFQYDVFVASDSTCWIERQTADFVEDRAILDSLSGEKTGSVPMAMGLSRRIPRTDNVQKILVLGDADCFSNGELGSGRLNYTSLNYTVLLEMFAWLADDEYPIDTSRPDPEDRGLYMGVEGRDMWKWMFVGVLPALMLAGALIITIRRKSR